MSETKTLKQKLATIQTELKAPKNKRNNFGGYSYRSAEDILEAVKPLCVFHGTILTVSDTITEVGGRVYVKATATLTDCQTEQTISTQAFAREAESKKGMDDSQVTGTASSYARKYALNGLFCIDDNQDADTEESIRAQVIAQVVLAETRQDFDTLQRQYLPLIRKDSRVCKAFERMAVILPKQTEQSAAEITQKAMTESKQ